MVVYKCSACGNLQEGKEHEDTYICKKCGSQHTMSFVASSFDPSESEGKGETVDEVVETETVKQEPVPAPKPKKKKKSVIGAIIGIVAVAIIAFGIYYFVPNLLNNNITIYFDADGGFLREKDAEREIGVGEYIGKFPVPTKPGFDFLGWADEYGKIYTRSDTFTTDMVLIAMWGDPSGVQCVDGTYNHPFSAWDYDDPKYQATCTEPQYRVRFCSNCGYEETEIGNIGALGHNMINPIYTENGISKTCDRCDNVEVTPYINVTQEALGSNKPYFENQPAQIYGSQNVQTALTNGNWDEATSSSFAVIDSEGVSLIFDFVSAVQIDAILFKGKGMATNISVSVMYEGEYDYTLIGTRLVGNYEEGKDTVSYISPEEGRNIVSVKFSYTDRTAAFIFDEVAFVKLPTE